MPIEFTQYPPQENTGVSDDTLFRLTVAYDGTGRRISKTRWVKAQGDAGWQRRHVTHNTGIGVEIRESSKKDVAKKSLYFKCSAGIAYYHTIRLNRSDNHIPNFLANANHSSFAMILDNRYMIIAR